ncbi:hypothetical protein B0H94_10428 [Salsuginibacillus halophilus]|uniref:SbsA Ig-like domain-containing protein n=2 Tax=Salsuginibacillus halophilus TaxID=517424 RepID=A0A2P8HQE4_9BACI|nr:hypothetical protein B0H94_10428 [Salsuginibacillus halophilus]
MLLSALIISSLAMPSGAGAAENDHAYEKLWEVPIEDERAPLIEPEMKGDELIFGTYELVDGVYDADVMTIDPGTGNINERNSIEGMDESIDVNYHPKESVLSSQPRNQRGDLQVHEMDGSHAFTVEGANRITNAYVTSDHVVRDGDDRVELVHRNGETETLLEDERASVVKPGVANKPMLINSANYLTLMYPDGDILWQTEINPVTSSFILEANSEGYYVHTQGEVWFISYEGEKEVVLNKAEDLERGLASINEQETYAFEVPMVYESEMNSELNVYDLSTGEQQTFSVDLPSTSSTAYALNTIVDETIYNSGVGGEIAAVNMQGVEQWRVRSESSSKFQSWSGTLFNNEYIINHERLGATVEMYNLDGEKVFQYESEGENQLFIVSPLDELDRFVAATEDSLKMFAPAGTTVPDADLPEVIKNHNWSITLSAAADEASVTEENVFIKDEAENKVDADVTLNESGDEIEAAAPAGGYDTDEVYTLHITEGVTSKDGTPLQDDTVHPFQITE